MVEVGTSESVGTGVEVGGVEANGRQAVRSIVIARAKPEAISRESRGLLPEGRNDMGEYSFIKE
jgi:hypothetical protein